MKCYVKKCLCSFPYHKTLNIHKEPPPPSPSLSRLYCWVIHLFPATPEKQLQSKPGAHPWNNLIEKIMSKQASAIKFHQATFLLYFIETAGELDQLLTKEKHIKRV